MAGPRDLVVRFLSDVTGFLRGTDDVAAAYRDVADAATDTAAAGETNAERLTRAYRDAASNMGTSASEGAGAFVDQTSAVVDKGQAKIRAVAGKQMKNLGKGLAGDMANGIQGFNPADLGGSVGSLLSSVTATNPFIAGAVAIGSVAAGLFFSNMAGANAAAKKMGKDLFTAMQDGILEQKERESLIEQALGTDNFSDVMDTVTAQAMKLKVPAADLLTYYMGMGQVAVPSVTAALDDAARAQGGVANQAAGVGQLMNDQTSAAGDVTSAVGLITGQWVGARGKVDIYNAGVKQTNALLDAQIAKMIQIGYGPGSATYRDQVGGARS